MYPQHSEKRVVATWSLQGWAMSADGSLGRAERSPHLLMYGRDRTILDLRRVILARAGYGATTAEDRVDLSEWLEWSDSPSDLLILCHTVSRGERISLEALATSARIAVYHLETSDDPRNLAASVARRLAQ
jgi:hypothetical protein